MDLAGKRMKKNLCMLASIMILSAGVACAGDLPARDTKLLEEAVIPLYEGAVYANGGLGDEVMGARFASSTAVGDVRDFYRKKFQNWALYDQYGGWILYDGKPGKKQIWVAENKNLPQWFGVSKEQDDGDHDRRTAEMMH